MLVLNEQEEIKDKIARRVPVIARKSSQEEPPKRKRTGDAFLSAAQLPTFDYKKLSISILYAKKHIRLYIPH